MTDRERRREIALTAASRAVSGEVAHAQDADLVLWLAKRFERYLQSGEAEEPEKS